MGVLIIMGAPVTFWGLSEKSHLKVLLLWL